MRAARSVLDDLVAVQVNLWPSEENTVSLRSYITASTNVPLHCILYPQDQVTIQNSRAQSSAPHTAEGLSLHPTHEPASDRAGANIRDTQDSVMPKRRKWRRGLSYLSKDAKRMKATCSVSDYPDVVQLSL